MAEAPHIRCDRRSLVGRKLRAPHWWHWAAKLLWLRHALNYGFLDSGIAAIAPLPILSGKSRAQRGALAALAMTPGTRRAADLTTINAFTERHHFLRRAFRSGKGARRDPTGVWMRTLWRLGQPLDDLTSRGCRTRTSGDVLATGCRAPAIDNSVDAPTDIVGNIEGSIRSHRQARGTMRGFARRLHRACETIRKDLALTGCVIGSERLKNNVVSALRIGRPIP